MEKARNRLLKKYLNFINIALGCRIDFNIRMKNIKGVLVNCVARTKLNNSSTLQPAATPFIKII
jgi:hypothetical protein